MNHADHQHHATDTHVADAHTEHGNVQVSGLAVSENGFTLELDSAIFASGTQDVTFRVLVPNGEAVTDFTPSHAKELHFIAVRRDAAGTWSVQLELTAGSWRFFTDFLPAGHATPVTLGIDAAVAGHFEPRQFLGAVAEANVGDYTVTIDGEMQEGQTGNLTFSVAKNSAPVTDL